MIFERSEEEINAVNAEITNSPLHKINDFINEGCVTEVNYLTYTEDNKGLRVMKPIEVSIISLGIFKSMYPEIHETPVISLKSKTQARSTISMILTDDSNISIVSGEKDQKLIIESFENNKDILEESGLKILSYKLVISRQKQI